MGKLSIFKMGINGAMNWPKSGTNLRGLRYAPERAQDVFTSSITKKRLATKSEVFNTRQYLLGKEVETKISPEEFKKLFEFDGEEFYLKAFQFLTKKLNVSESLTPQFRYLEVNPTAKMAYDYASNVIYVNPNCKFASKAEFLALLRHEFQHYLQNMNVYRHPQKGAEIVDFYTKGQTKAQMKQLDSLARNCSIEELQKMGMDDSALNDFKMLKELLANNNIEGYELQMKTFCNSLEETNHSRFENFRQTIMKEMGLLQDGSREARRGEKYFAGIVDEQSYWQKDGIDYSKYLYDIRENEALVAQDMVMMSANGRGCYIRQIRESINNLEKNMPKESKFNKDLDNATENLDIKSTTGFKELLSYLFD